MSLLLHWIHLLAAVAWIGGVTYLVLVLFPSLPAVDPGVRITVMPHLMRRFLRYVWGSVLLLLLTGLYRILVVNQMWTADAWFRAGYGHTLMTKLLLYLLLVGIATHLTAVTYPRVRRHAAEHTAIPTETACATCARLVAGGRRMMWIAWAIGLIVFLLAARLRGA